MLEKKDIEEYKLPGLEVELLVVVVERTRKYAKNLSSGKIAIVVRVWRNEGKTEETRQQIVAWEMWLLVQLERERKTSFIAAILHQYFPWRYMASFLNARLNANMVDANVPFTVREDGSGRNVGSDVRHGSEHQ